jgi:hypothetical protein
LGALYPTCETRGYIFLPPLTRLTAD